MKLHTLIASAILLAAVPAVESVASAQPGGYYAQPPMLENGFHPRGGRLTLGVNLGLGYMKADSGPIDCNCSYSPLTLGIAGHIGGMLNERLALMLELQANGQVIDEVGPYAEQVTLVQTAAMFAAQYWVTPQLWVKGGLGAAHLTFAYEFGGEDPVDDGLALLLSGGYELLSARNYSIDLQGRLFIGNYDGIDDQITSGTIGVGFNWF